MYSGNRKIQDSEKLFFEKSSFPEKKTLHISPGPSILKSENHGEGHPREGKEGDAKRKVGSWRRNCRIM